MSSKPSGPAAAHSTCRREGTVASADPVVEVRSNGLLLRPWRPGDADALVQVYDDPEAARWTPVPTPFDLTEARAYLRRVEERRADGFVQLAVVPRGEGVVGEVLLMPTRSAGTCELGYAIAARHRGRGFATRSLALVLSTAGRAGHVRARLRIAVGNLASEAVATRLGFLIDPVEPVVEVRKGRKLQIAQWSRDLPTTEHPQARGPAGPRTRGPTE